MATKRLLRNIDPNDVLAGLTVTDLKNEYKKLKTKYDKVITGYYCHWCDQFLPAEKFYLSDKWKSGVVPTCKLCLQKIASSYNPKTGKGSETPETIRKALKLMNLPFLNTVYNGAKRSVENVVNENRKSSIFSQMVTSLQAFVQYKGMTYEDSDFEADDIPEESEVRISKTKKETAVKRFGDGFTDSDYVFLENEYNDWTSRYTCENKAQEVLFIRICCKQLEIHKAQINGEDTKDLDKSLQDLMGSLNIRPSQKDAKNLTESKSFGQLIEMWEEEEPIPEPDEDLADVDNIEKNLRVWFGGWLAHALGLNVPISKEYEEEVAKYTIDSPNIEQQNTSSALYKELFGDADE